MWDRTTVQLWSVKVMFVPAFCAPTFTQITPCVLPEKFCVIEDAPVPMKVPPVIVPEMS